MEFRRAAETGLMAALALVVLCAGRAGANDLAFAVAPTANDSFRLIDLTTGTETVINGSMGVNLNGLGELGTTIYGLDAAGQMYTINPNTGVPTALPSPSGLPGGSCDFGSTLSGLFATDSTCKNLHQIDPITGIAGPTIGTFSMSFSGSGSFSTGSSTLYLITNQTLFTVNTSNAQATAIGSGLGLSGSNGIPGLTTVNGTLYGAEFDTSGGMHDDTLNTVTGTATRGPTLPAILIVGMAPESLVPEPGTWGMAGVGIGSLALLRRVPRR